MTFDRFDYSPIVDRPKLMWPGGKRLALWVSPNIEYYEYEPPGGQRGRIPAPDVRGYSLHAYGNRIALWRMFDVFDKHGIKCTVSLNEAVLEHLPEVRDAMVERDWSYMSHGIYNTRNLLGMSADEERAFYVDCIETLRKHTGKQLKGVLGPGMSANVDTPDLMAEAGLLYHANWFEDDQPFPLNVRSGRLISMPYSLEMNDQSVITRWGHDAPYYAQICKDQFDVLYEQAKDNARVMCIALHPSVIGQPHRIRYLDDVFTYILGHDDVWLTTADEIAGYYMENHYELMVEHLRQRKAAMGRERS